ncbi:MAG: hypothetical protein K6G84_11815, partial [Lachnospiraceae bacterium]|nr:hypothetical protein [Lachnospiraceae bacterium]
MDNKNTSKGSYQLNSILRVEDKAFFVPINRRILVEYSITENREMALYELPDFSYDGLNPFLDIVCCCEKIVIIPNHTDVFIIFDLDSKTFSTINIPQNNINCHPWGYFSNAIVYKNKVYAIGQVYPGIVQVDVEQCTTEIVLNMSTEEKTISRFVYDSVFYEGNIFLLSAIDNYLHVFSLDALEVKSIRLGIGDEPQYKTIAINNGFVWLVKNDGSIYSFNVSFVKPDYEIRMQTNFITKLEKIKNNTQIRSVSCGKYIIIGTDNGIINVINMNERDSKVVDFGIDQSPDEYHIYCFFDNEDKNISFLDRDKLKNYRIDIIEKRITEIKIARDDKKYFA